MHLPESGVEIDKVFSCLFNFDPPEWPPLELVRAATYLPHKPPGQFQRPSLFDHERPR